MHELDLPLVGLGTSLEDAFRKLQSHQRSAIAVHRGDMFGVVTAQQIIQEAQKGTADIGDIEPIAVHSLPGVDLLFRAGARFRAGAAQSIRIPASVTLSVGPQMHTLWMRGPDKCQCLNPEEHHGPYLPSDDGRVCDECQYTVHCAPWGD